MKDIDQFVFYKLGHYLRLHPLWDDIPFDAKNLLKDVGKTVAVSSEAQPLSHFEEFWIRKLYKVQKSGQDYITPVVGIDKITFQLKGYVKEQEDILLRQQNIFKMHPFFPMPIWQELVRTWQEEQDATMDEGSVFLTSRFFFPLRRGLTYQKLALTRREYKATHHNKIRKTPSLRQLSLELLDITESLKTLDVEVDRLYKFMDTLFWSYRRQKSNAHQLEGVGREFLHMSEALEHAKDQLKTDASNLFLGHGFMSYVVYFENPQWVGKEMVEDLIMKWHDKKKEQLLALLDKVLLQGGHTGRNINLKESNTKGAP